MAEPELIQEAGRVQPSEEAVKPPIPKWMYKIVNPTMAAIIRSPFHRLMSNSLMLLSFRGRKSFKRYSIPVGYQQRENRLYIFSHAGWWRNLDGQRVMVRLRGKDVHGVATRLEGPREIAELVRLSIEQRGEQMAERMGLTREAA